mmetsp:Transcript_25417/g.78460  ORF Transcript_25417/g.78460 Transcript_25417/m.78460 type:complete len:311 (+) Transcript_25417:744-1676(+)
MMTVSPVFSPLSGPHFRRTSRTLGIIIACAAGSMWSAPTWMSARHASGRFATTLSDMASSSMRLRTFGSAPCSTSSGSSDRLASVQLPAAAWWTDEKPRTSFALAFDPASMRALATASNAGFTPLRGGRNVPTSLAPQMQPSSGDMRIMLSRRLTSSKRSRSLEHFAMAARTAARSPKKQWAMNGLMVFGWKSSPSERICRNWCGFPRGSVTGPSDDWSPSPNGSASFFFQSHSSLTTRNCGSWTSSGTMLFTFSRSASGLIAGSAESRQMGMCIPLSSLWHFLLQYRAHSHLGHKVSAGRFPHLTQPRA